MVCSITAPDYSNLSMPQHTKDSLEQLAELDPRLVKQKSRKKKSDVRVPLLFTYLPVYLLPRTDSIQEQRTSGGLEANASSYAKTVYNTSAGCCE